MNSYFVAHPEMVLGDTVEESTAYGMDITVRPIEGMELSELLKEAVSHIQGTYQAVELPEADKGKEIETIPATPDVKNLLPSEKAFAYKMKMDAMKRQGARNDIASSTSTQIGWKSETAEAIGKQVGESKNQVRRYIRLTELITE